MLHHQKLLLICILGSARGCPGSTCISPVWVERCTLSLSLASALTANVTREAKRGTSIEGPGDTDTAKQAREACLERAVKAHMHRKRIKLDKALHIKHA